MTTNTPIATPGLGALFMDFAREAVRSKKFWALILGIFVSLLALFAPKLGICDEQVHSAVTQITPLVGTYILGQGVADHGKERAKSEAAKAIAALSKPTPAPAA